MNEYNQPPDWEDVCRNQPKKKVFTYAIDDGVAEMVWEDSPLNMEPKDPFETYNELVSIIKEHEAKKNRPR